MSQPAGDSVQADERPRQRSRSSYLMIALIVVALAAIILYLLPMDEYVFLPGDALPVAPMISVKGHPPRPKRGSLYLTDVSLVHVTHRLEDVILRVISSDADFEPARNVSGPFNAQQFNQLNISLMTGSIQAAEAAALSMIPGYHPHFARTGPKIVAIVSHLPAARVLRLGDVVLAIDGHRTRRATSVAPVVQRVRPGSTIVMRIMRGKKVEQVRVRTVPSTNGQPSKHGKKALIGIELIDQIVFPVKISINVGDIGGPSAGLMFALGIVQRFSPTDITHGCRIAGTGEIDANGNVSAIGGVWQKIVAARHVHAQYFLVPDVPANVQPARQHRGNITVVPVKTLSQALAFLKRLKPCR